MLYTSAINVQCLLMQLLADWPDFYSVPFYEFRKIGLIVSDLCRRKASLSGSSALCCLQDIIRSYDVISRCSNRMKASEWLICAYFL